MKQVNKILSGLGRSADQSQVQSGSFGAGASSSGVRRTVRRTEVVQEVVKEEGQSKFYEGRPTISGPTGIRKWGEASPAQNPNSPNAGCRDTVHTAPEDVEEAVEYSAPQDKYEESEYAEVVGEPEAPAAQDPNLINAGCRKAIYVSSWDSEVLDRWIEDSEKAGMESDLQEQTGESQSSVLGEGEQTWGEHEAPAAQDPNLTTVRDSLEWDEPWDMYRDMKFLEEAFEKINWNLKPMEQTGQSQSSFLDEGEQTDRTGNDTEYVEPTADEIAAERFGQFVQDLKSAQEAQEAAVELWEPMEDEKMQQPA